MSTLGKREWWTLPANFIPPLVFYMEEDQEKHIFGHGDVYLHRIEVNSHTLIQLESWFTATGQTRVTVVGPLRARRWLMDMIQSVGSQRSYIQARGLKMLQRVRSQPLTEDDLTATTRVGPDTWNLSVAARMRETTLSAFLRVPFINCLLGLGSIAVCSIHDKELTWEAEM